MPAPKIPEVNKGQAPTLLETEKANKVIKALNVLGNITINANSEQPSVEYTDTGVKLNIPKPDIADFGPTQVELQYPLALTKEGNNYMIYLEGYTKFIRYCGGAGHILFLEDGYDSTKFSNNLQ